ncbi:response regulator [Chryseobacterium sp. POL2]|uniref:response regulator n=1 Tax=Chryseobacterium sp. POL2 TaxID=2713414 RepID=UPI0013E1AB00|nr:response regulator [Chryseobacterium sp. POL2]QIG88780.1 response regulator [Chryseobacterium sp. POL2]
MAKKIIRNLQFGIGMSLFMLFASLIISYFSIQKQVEFRENRSQSRRSITAAKDVLFALLDAETGNRGFQLSGQEAYLEPFERGMAEYPKAIANLKNLSFENKIQKERANELEKLVNERSAVLEYLIDKKRKGEDISQSEMLKSKTSMDKTRKLVDDFVNFEENQLDLKNAELKKSSEITNFFLLFSGLAAIVITSYLYFRLRNDIRRRDILERKLLAKDKMMTNRVNAIQQVANRVAKGDYSQRAIAEEEDDLGVLVESLNHMTESLQKSFNKINKSDWNQKGLASLNEFLVGNKSIKELSHSALNHLVEYGNCASGALYLLDDNALKLFSSYGLENNVKTVFEPGQGILGQSFLQKRIKAYNNIKEEDVVASFVSAQLRINGILHVPIMLGNQAIGIIELNSGENFNDDLVNFYVECCRIIGIAINAAQGREKEQRLLEETQAQSEELQVQHSELENLNTELEAQTQKLQASEEELRVQQEELMQTNAELEERSKLLEEKNHLIADRNIEIQKKAEELALSTKYKSEFLANMSHELRTPLNSILLLSRLMAENPDENLNEDQIESAKVILSSGSSLLTLIDEILDLAKIESGKMSLDYQKVFIQDVVKDLQKLFNPLMQEKNIDFIINIDPELQTSIETDRLRLDQVLRNLMSNALKFTAQGNIRLNIRKDPAQQDFVIFSVKDTGIGIPEDKQRIIFEAFQQADGSTRRKFGGTGLGLSISREIAKLLGGELLLQSKVNEGSEFSLVIPISSNLKTEYVNRDQDLIETIQEDIQEIKEIIAYDDVELPVPVDILRIPEDIPDDRDRILKDDKVILIVEDDVNFAKALVKYAHTQNYKAVAIVRGDYALQAALNYHPLAILLDVQLPVKDGWQVMDELKANLQTKHIPVHMMSSLHVKQESLMKGAIDFISKPIALEQMADVFKKIEDALSKSLQKVLIVEENARHATALSYFLSNFNISSSVEDTAENCVKAFTQQNLDCVILNVEHSRGEEYAIIESIKSHEGLENLPIIIFIDRNLSKSEELKIKQYADSIVVKTAHSYQRILDEVGLFLHLVEEKNNHEETRSTTLGSLTEVLSGKKILITDDDVRNIFSLTKVLEKYKVEVVLAMDGKQALHQIKEHPDIDVILMDMMMPEMDGYETIREIRKQPTLARLPIIAITAKSMIGEREKCIEAGASDYISKPVDTDQLLSLLRVWMYES